MTRVVVFVLILTIGLYGETPMSHVLSEDALAVLTIYGEARGESFEGKVAVGEVIRQRMLQRYASDGTVADTVLRPYQFSIWNTGGPQTIADLDDEDELFEECLVAWRASQYSNLTNHATLYFNPKLAQPAWADTTKFLVQIGNHRFYKEHS